MTVFTVTSMAFGRLIYQNAGKKLKHANFHIHKTDPLATQLRTDLPIRLFSDPVLLLI